MRAQRRIGQEPSAVKVYQNCGMAEPGNRQPVIAPACRDGFVRGLRDGRAPFSHTLCEKAASVLARKTCIYFQVRGIDSHGELDALRRLRGARPCYILVRTEKRPTPGRWGG